MRAGFRRGAAAAIILLPHWNADALAYNSLCRVMNMLGLPCCALTMPYHDIRMPAGDDPR